MQHAGSTHDSQAWRRSELYAFIDGMGGLPWGYWIAGDEAYANSNWLLTPYSASSRGSWATRVYKDSFNFHQSSQRITVECAFGILVKRWGILWRSLEVALPNVKRVIGACVALHNICIDARESSALGADMSLPPGVNGWGSGVARRPRTWREAAPHGHSINHQEGFPTVYFNTHRGVSITDHVSHRGQGQHGQGALRDTFRSKLQERGLKRLGTSSYGMPF